QRGESLFLPAPAEGGQEFDAGLCLDRAILGKAQSVPDALRMPQPEDQFYHPRITAPGGEQLRQSLLQGTRYPVEPSACEGLHAARYDKSLIHGGRSLPQELRAGGIARLGAFRGVATGQPLGEVLPDRRPAPCLGGLEQKEHPVRVTDRLVLHRPPQQQRNVDVAGILVVLEQFANDGEGVPAWETFGRTC